MAGPQYEHKVAGVQLYSNGDQEQEFNSSSVIRRSIQSFKYSCYHRLLRTEQEREDYNSEGLGGPCF